MKRLIAKCRELKECIAGLSANLAPYPVAPVGDTPYKPPVKKDKKKKNAQKPNSTDIQ